MSPVRRVLITILALLIAVAPASSFEWQSAAQKVSRSLVSLSTFNGQIYCTGFVIDDKRDFVMTAYHCVDHNEGYIVDHKVGWVVWSDKDLDLAVLQVPGLPQPELRPGKHPQIGQEIAAFGYGYGFEQPSFRVGKVSHPAVKVRELTGLWVITDFTLIPGMSGGPMTSTDGKVVAINLRGNDNIGLGKSILDIYKTSKDFWRYSD